jgi:large subunit ribosomal protein L1
MARHGKKYRASLEKMDRSRLYPLQEAVGLVKQLASVKFDETVDVAIRLGLDLGQSDQVVRGASVLPHGLGKTVRVLAFVKGEKEQEAKAAGADYVGGDDLIKKVQEGWIDFDTVIATPDLMGQVGRLGKILGPRGLMPNPKLGTVTFDVSKAVREAKAGKIEFRSDKGGVVHAPVGKVSFNPEHLAENVRMVLEAIQRLRPASAKGTYFRAVYLSSTMGPSVKVDTSTLVEEGV